MCSQGSLYTSPNLNRCEALPSPYLPPSLPFSISLSSFSLPLPSLFSLCYPFLSYLLAPSQIFGSCEARRLEWQPSVTPPVEEEAVSKLQLHKDNPPDTPPDRHGDPLLTPEVSGGEETASETQIEGREETPLWPQQPRNDPLCCEKRSSPEHQEDTPLPQCESKTATDSSKGEVPLQVLESRRDPSLELQLKKLFDSTKSLTAKENLLLSLRYCLHLPSSLPSPPSHYSFPSHLPLTSHHPSPPLTSPYFKWWKAVSRLKYTNFSLHLQTEFSTLCTIGTSFCSR